MMCFATGELLSGGVGASVAADAREPRVHPIYSQALRHERGM